MQRRKFIQDATLTAISISAFGSLAWKNKAYSGNTPTTTDILGPFYRPGSPIRSNLRLPGSTGMPIVLKGRICKEDGQTPIHNALVEIWHCNEKEIYDNTSDDYNYRGMQKTTRDGAYAFKTILPVPYKADPTNDQSWRPAHIHLRVSVPNQQDLITQIYFKDGKYIDTDKWASDPNALNRILPISSNHSGEREIVFNVTMNKEIPLDPKVFEKFTGLYEFSDGYICEFQKWDDLLLMKQNGQISESLKYTGNNKFVGGIGFPKVSFEIQADGQVKVLIEELDAKTYMGKRYLKYTISAPPL
ncbi:MAG: hypothetical protein WBP58_09445 [Chitinophagaceae bacterium]